MILLISIVFDSILFVKRIYLISHCIFPSYFLQTLHMGLLFKSRMWYDLYNNAQCGKAYRK